jgi:hypothetical protein
LKSEACFEKDLKILEHITEKILLKNFHIGSLGDVGFQSEILMRGGAG